MFTGIAPYVAAPFPAGEDVEQWSNGGTLVLDVSPRSAQVFVDGVYVGTVQEFNDRGGLLAPGVHAIAIRAPGYGSVNVSVSVEAGRAISYHAGLPPLSATPAAPPPPPAAASTAPFYIIPGCYFGNRRPDNSSLPPGCDPSKVRTIDMRR